MNKKIGFLIIFGFSYLLSGCSSSPVFDCPMGKSCAPIEDVYNSAKTDKSIKGWSVYKSKKEENDNEGSGSKCLNIDDGCLIEDDPKNKNKLVVRESILSPKARDSLDGAIYHPAKPYQIWLAPFRDDQGILYSGNYVWITTPAYWTYAGVKVPSSSVSRNTDGYLAPAFIQDYTPPSSSNPLQQAVDALNKSK